MKKLFIIFVFIQVICLLDIHLLPTKESSYQIVEMKNKYLYFDEDNGCIFHTVNSYGQVYEFKTSGMCAMYSQGMSDGDEIEISKSSLFGIILGLKNYNSGAVYLGGSATDAIFFRYLIIITMFVQYLVWYFNLTEKQLKTRDFVGLYIIMEIIFYLLLH
ncbi:hypothetical protein CJF42_05805 [Pseudoalteromonas sp. NBT06-2]|uniref:hypothetical protein n=1 Tax=Pseudoalteromonas sp. NBT06-2 TaxID=2025950 RepID=UPI000BA5EA7B|nr:hypothetical protein [Pseudoalteromonas sp. NBT06-2]PAJ75354.1 hypothetical protein CJF42_05805 [Pseudoalteromonas sp. NBT06-2]